jgi:hypothetical protein
VFRLDMIDEEIENALTTILSAVGVQLMQPIHLKDRDTSLHSAPFRLEHEHIIDDSTFLEFNEALAYVKKTYSPGPESWGAPCWEILNHWGNTVYEHDINSAGWDDDE